MTAYERFQKDQTFRYRIIGMLAQQGYIFHGTNEKFDAFDSNQIKGGSRGREGYGAYFTNEAYKAEEYGNEFVILSTKGMNIVDSNNTFSQLNIISPYDIKNRIELLNYQLDNVRNNREYDAINNEIEQYKTYLNDKLLSGIAYNDYELLSLLSSDEVSGLSASTIPHSLLFSINILEIIDSTISFTSFLFKVTTFFILFSFIILLIRLSLSLTILLFNFSKLMIT